MSEEAAEFYAGIAARRLAGSVLHLNDERYYNQLCQDACHLARQQWDMESEQRYPSGVI